MNRRGFLAGILAAAAAPAIARAASLMPVRALESGVLVAPEYCGWASGIDFAGGDFAGDGGDHTAFIQYCINSGQPIPKGRWRIVGVLYLPAHASFAKGAELHL